MFNILLFFLCVQIKLFHCHYITLYVAIHDVTVFIIKVAVLMHEHVHSCLHLSIVNKMLFISLFYVYVYFIYDHCVLTMKISEFESKSESESVQLAAA